MSPRHRLTKRGRRLLAVAGFLLLTGAGSALFLTYSWYERDSPAPLPDSGRVKRVEIPPRLTAEDVAKILEREGIIASASAFLVQARAQGADGELRPGTYEFRVGQDYAELIAALRRGGAPSTFKVTLPEGLSADQAAERLSADTPVRGAEYLELAGRPDKFVVPLVGGMTPRVEDLEGLLFPSTYFIPEDGGAADLIRLQLAAFAAKTVDLPWRNAEALGVTPYQVVIVASLIEKEARIPEERARVAAVIYNRLKKGMPLGIDASVRFALKKWTGDLTKSDLEVDSPYNTRRYGGLPPGPIASPGLAALKAALEPEKVDFLYYVLIDAAGHHFFTSSYADFLKAKAAARRQ